MWFWLPQHSKAESSGHSERGRVYIERWIQKLEYSTWKVCAGGKGTSWNSKFLSGTDKINGDMFLHHILKFLCEGNLAQIKGNTISRCRWWHERSLLHSRCSTGRRHKWTKQDVEDLWLSGAARSTSPEGTDPLGQPWQGEWRQLWARLRIPSCWLWELLVLLLSFHRLFFPLWSFRQCFGF